MSQLLDAWNRHRAPLAYLAAAAVLGSLALPWLGGEAGTGFTALQAAQLFLGPAAWLLFGLLVSALLYLLRPVHDMKRATDLLALLVLPAWLVVAGTLLLGTQHQSLASGAWLAGLAAALLSASGLGGLWPARADHAPVLQTKRLALLVTRMLS